MFLLEGRKSNKERRDSMEIIIILLIVILVILSFYLYLLKKEMRRTTIALKNIEQENSNQLLNQQMDDKSMNQLIFQINLLLKAIHEKEINLKTKNESLQKMMINMAHDLRTPLTSAIGYIDMIQKEALSMAEKEKYMGIIEERLNKLSDLITNFFDFSKAISEEEIEKRKENLMEILENSLANFYDDFTKQNRKIDLNSKVSKIEIVTNRALLIRIFDNLIVNSYKHSKSDLKINVQIVENKVVLEFINELEDLSLDVQKMFEEFYTTDDSRNNGNTGLGLAIVKEFVRLLGGSIKAQKVDHFLKIILKL